MSLELNKIRLKHKGGCMPKLLKNTSRKTYYELNKWVVNCSNFKHNNLFDSLEILEEHFI